MEVYRFQSKATRRYHDLKRMKELQEQYLYLVNHKIESADELIDCHVQIKEKIADISAEQKTIYAENRKLGRLAEDEAESIRQENTERLDLYQSYLRLEFEPETNKDKKTDPLHPTIPESPWEKERKDAEYKKKLDELLAKLHANDEVNKVKNPASDNLTEVPAELQADSHEEPQMQLQTEPQPVPQIESQQEPQATPQLPDSFSAFKSLPVSTQSQLLCTELCDTMQVFEQLQQYAKDTGYHGSFDELYEMASAISEENSRSYEDRKAQMIADELIRAGATVQNFYQIKTESLAEFFVSSEDIDSSLIPLIIKVEQKLGVEPNYEKILHW